MSELAQAPSDATTASPPVEAGVDAAGTAKKTRGAFFLRLGIAHLVAYPLAFAWAVACIPAMIALLPEAFVVNEPTETVVHVILHRLAWPAVGVFVLEHLVVIPWAVFGSARARRAFWALTLGLGVVAMLGGGASWLWLVLR